MKIQNFSKKNSKGFTPLEITGAKKKHKVNKSLTGFTLVEMLVAITIFSVTTGVISGIYVSGINQQRRALVSQTILDQTSFALEYMSRALRMAKKELSNPPDCLSQRGLNYEITHSGSGLKFINHLQDDDCQEFFLEGGLLKYRRNIGKALEETLPLISNKIEIVSLKFNLAGESQNDDLQPRLTIFLEISGKGALEGSQKIKIQTSISQRNLDVSY
jgi:prepilin-type N-terminal cleavage/methylation domain-containing protein